MDFPTRTSTQPSSPPMGAPAETSRGPDWTVVTKTISTAVTNASAICYSCQLCCSRGTKVPLGGLVVGEVSPHVLPAQTWQFNQSSFSKHFNCFRFYSCLCYGNRHNLKTICPVSRGALLSVCVCCWCWAVSWQFRRQRRIGGISCSGWRSDRTVDSRRRPKRTTDDPGTGSRPSVGS